MWIFLALLIVPLIEIALFIEVGGLIGLWPTIAVVILTAVLGTVLLRAQGFAALGDLQRQLSSGEDPTNTLAHGALILISGVVLLTPGFFTDAIGFLLLVPPVRGALIGYVRARVRVVAAAQAGAQQRTRPSPGQGAPGSQTVDGEYEDVTPAETTNGPPLGDGRQRPSGWTKTDSGN